MESSTNSSLQNSWSAVKLDREHIWTDILEVFFRAIDAQLDVGLNFNQAILRDKYALK